LGSWEREGIRTISRKVVIQGLITCVCWISSSVLRIDWLVYKSGCVIK
jgi:hypothetical protein